MLQHLNILFRGIIPEPQHRIPLSWNVAPYVLAHYVPFVLLAYLARRPNTYFTRLLLFPIIVYTILSAAFGYQWTIPSLNVYNWGQCASRVSFHYQCSIRLSQVC